jgi:hypothetical protein
MSVDHFKHLSSLYDNKPSHWYNFRFYLQEYKVWVLYVFSATFSHISFLSKWSVLLVEDSNRSTRRLNSLTNLINQCCIEYTLYHGWKSNSPSVDMIVDLFCENWFFRAMQELIFQSYASSFRAKYINDSMFIKALVRWRQLHYFLPLFWRFNPAEPVVEKSVIL